VLSICHRHTPDRYAQDENLIGRSSNSADFDLVAMTPEEIADFDERVLVAGAEVYSTEALTLAGLDGPSRPQ
jgi:hypothetical protein